MDSVSLHCLGVGDGTASLGRNHSSYLFSFGSTRVLIDCGEPVGRSLKLAGVQPDDIDHLFLSHLHSDHIGGFLMLLQGFWLDQRRKDLTVRMPKDGIEPLRQMVRTAYLFDEVLPFKLRFEAICPRQGIELAAEESVRVTLFPTTHLDRARKTFQSIHPGDYSAFSFLFETPTRRVVHSADIGAPQDLEPLLARPVDLLVCELAHFEPEELFRYLQGRPIKRLVLTHVARYYWQDKMDEVRHAAADALGKMNPSFARDGEVIEL